MSLHPLAALLLVLSIALSASGSSAHGQECPAKIGDCLEPHGGMGCTDEECCLEVCGIDPFCCLTWDESCADTASLSCEGLCGAEASGSCFLQNGTASCDDLDCCTGVCLIDPYCCETLWDGNCVLIASFSCSTGGGSCGDPRSGDCLEANGTPACRDAGCCEAVCDLDPRCCEVVWDVLCVGAAQSVCSEGCALGPDAGTLLEAEECEDSSNDPCSGGTPEPLPFGTVLTGSLRQGVDTDVYEVDVAADDLDGDGLVRLRIRYVSSAFTTLRVSAADCTATSLVEVDGAGCFENDTYVCVPAGPVWISIGSRSSRGACFVDAYLLAVDRRDVCGVACGSGGDCLLPAPNPGCADTACCEVVCGLDPLCCEWEWDRDCASLAASECGGPPPVNDDCDSATEVFQGRSPFRELLSTLDGPAESCLADGSEVSGDVWFRHVVDCDGTLVIGTCDTVDFDTVLEVYRGDCGEPQSLACVDNDPACFGNTGFVILDEAVCGETLLIRMGGVDGSTGTGELVIECLGDACACAGDFDGDGKVDGADFGLLLVDWGPCGKNCETDLDGNGVVDGSDLGLLLIAWGDC